jgi:hypothetical protein
MASRVRANPRGRGCVVGRSCCEPEPGAQPLVRADSLPPAAPSAICRSTRTLAAMVRGCAKPWRCKTAEGKRVGGVLLLVACELAVFPVAEFALLLVAVVRWAQHVSIARSVCASASPAIAIVCGKHHSMKSVWAKLAAAWPRWSSSTKAVAGSRARHAHSWQFNSLVAAPVALMQGGLVP